VRREERCERRDERGERREERGHRREVWIDDPGFLSCAASYEGASHICQALVRGRARARGEVETLGGGNRQGSHWSTLWLNVSTFCWIRWLFRV